MKKLHMTFLNEDGSKKTLIIHCVQQALTPNQVREAMEQIAELDLFEKDGVRLMTEAHSAKYVEVIETPLFDVKDEVPSIANEIDESIEASDENVLELEEEFADVAKEEKENWVTTEENKNSTEEQLIPSNYLPSFACSNCKMIRDWINCHDPPDKRI